jgi:NADH-quinone oxidoreductase subunit I
VGAIAKGMALTFKHMFRKKVTQPFPEFRRTKPARYHGRHVLNRYPDGMEKCIGCELCAGVCPARCIYVRGADNPPDAPVSPGERYGFIYEINMLRCIYCAMCVEACPTEAITMTHLFEFSMVTREEGIYTKEHLLVEPDGTPVQKPHHGPPQVGLEQQGWMQAVAPNGAAAYEGRVLWSGEPGQLRPAEPDQDERDRGPGDAGHPSEGAAYAGTDGGDPGH